MKCILAAAALLALLPPASAAPPDPVLAQKSEGSSGWWENITGKTWELTFAPGDIRYGFRPPLIPLLAGLVLLTIGGAWMNSAKRKNQSARAGAGITS